MTLKPGDRVVLNYPYPYKNNGAMGVIIADSESRFNWIPYLKSYLENRVMVRWDDFDFMGTSCEKVTNLRLVKTELKLVD